MSHATATNESLFRQIDHAHDTLINHMSGLRERSMELLVNVEQVSRSNKEHIITAAETLIAKALSFSTSYTKIAEERVRN